MRNVYDAYEAGQKGLGKRMACGIRPRLMLRTLLVVACLLCGTFTYAYDFEVDGIYYNILSSEDKTCEVTYRLGSGRSYTGDIVIPHEVVYEGQTLKVTSIGDYAFFYCSGLTSVTIPESITNIGDNAFMSCFGLTEVNVDNGNVSYTSIDGVLFSKDLSVLHQFPAGKKGPFTIPESVTSIGVDAFRDCSGLTSVIIGESVTTIGDGAFYFCSGLTSVTIPESVTSIGGHTFQDCFGLTSVTIPNSVTSIGDYAFDGCSGLRSVTIPNSVTSIGDNAFDGCSGLTSVAIPNSVTSIGGGAFWDCSGLMNVTISNSVTSIGVCAFNGCSGLTSVTIPNSVTSIGVDAFRDCFGLTSVIIGESVTSIGDGAFYDCSNLNTVYSYAVIPPILDLGNFTTEQCQSMVLYVPKGTLEAYRAATNWGNIVNIREMDGTGVPSIVGGDNEAERTYYDMQGRKLVTPQRGLNIIDGRKVLIRE